MQIQFLVAEAECSSPTRERDRVHLEHPGIERTRRFDIANGEDEVIEAVNVH